MIYRFNAYNGHIKQMALQALHRADVEAATVQEAAREFIGALSFESIGECGIRVNHAARSDDGGRHWELIRYDDPALCEVINPDGTIVAEVGTRSLEAIRAGNCPKPAGRVKTNDLVNHEFHGRGRVQYVMTIPAGDGVESACVHFHHGDGSTQILPVDELERR